MLTLYSHLTSLINEITLNVDLCDSFKLRLKIGLKLFNEYYLQKNKYLKISRLKLNLKLFHKKSTFLVD